MKLFSGVLLFTFILLMSAGCTGRSSGKKESKVEADTVTVPDTGFTGIKQFKSGPNILREATFKNGVRYGLTKTFYAGGQLYQTFWYENDLREDSARWYYLEGQVFRTTPYKRDTIDGIQIQYYRTGKVKAKIGYSKGLRTTFFEEYNQNGKLIRGYPEIVVSTTDEYKSRGLYRIGLELSDKSTKVKFYRGEFTEGRFDTAMCRVISTKDGKGTLTLKKSGSSEPPYVGVIAEIITSFGNRYLSARKIDLPYNDLK